MSERANELHATADRQVADLLDLVAALDDETSRRPCPGRDKLGDGTVAASAQHTADNYERIADFLTASRRASAAHAPAKHGGHRIPRFLRSRGHGSAEHAEHGPSAGRHDAPYTADNTDLADLTRRLSTTRDALRQIAELTDGQLNAIPPGGSFRFCDGRRTLEQVLASLLKHQGHQLGALTAALV
ncbi:MAG: hypothetical protein JO243_24685 [Solirubrobacterales bacterium]|nr:hypothetical protein [Solirubrobacterales bacterium]